MTLWLERIFAFWADSSLTKGELLDVPSGLV